MYGRRLRAGLKRRFCARSHQSIEVLQCVSVTALCAERTQAWIRY